MSQSNNYDLIVIGGGPAGMMAAAQALKGGCRVLLIDKMEQFGRKLRITGKGRCNLTNTAPLREYLTHIGPDSRFLRNCFSMFFNQELIDFFEARNVPLVEERGKRIFPKSGKALDIFLALINELEHNPNIDLRQSTSVKEILFSPLDEKQVSGIRTTEGLRMSAPHVIVATGGLSYPSTGSTGVGLRIAQECGHKVIEPVPALVPLTVAEELPEEMVGFVVKNAGLRITHPDGKVVYDGFGELSFCDDGLTGPLTLTASRFVSRDLQAGKTFTAHLDLKPALDEKTLDQRLINDLDANGTRLFHDALRLWLPAELIPLVLSRAKIEYYKRLNQINGAERKRLLKLLKDLTFTITATHGFEEAIVTQGGVDVKEINPKTMESRLVKGLYFAGEVLNIDGDTGGFNLQCAFSTGFAAGKAVADACAQKE